MTIMKKNIIGHIFFIIWWSTKRGIRFKTIFYLKFFIYIFHQTDVRLLIIWTTTLLTVWDILGNHKTFLQVGTLNLHMWRLSTFKADDLVAFLVFLFESGVISSRGMLKLSFLSSAWNFWTWEPLHHLWILKNYCMNY